jgi:hypothetical protein
MTDRLSPSQHVLQYFSHSHLPAPLQAVVKPIADLAVEMEHAIPDGPEKTMGLRKLLEAKDCLVRGMLSPEKPWWQTSDLTEIKAPAVTGLLNHLGIEGEASIERAEDGVPVVTPPEDLAEATLQRKADNERAQAKATNVVEGHCYGPVALSDPEMGVQEAICFHTLCSWERRGIPEGTKSLQELQQAHNDAQMPLVD